MVAGRRVGQAKHLLPSRSIIWKFQRCWMPKMSNAKTKMFYGWWVALTAALGLFLNTGTIVVFSFGIFSKAIGQEFHSSRAPISLAFTIHNLTAALFVPLAGRLVDHYGARRVILPFTVFLGLILVSSRILSQAIWQLYAFYFLLGMVSGGAGAMSYTRVISRWFDRRRGLALSVMMLGMGVGAIVMPPIAQQLVARFGWRSAYGTFGLAVLLVPFPMVAAFLKDGPENLGRLPDGAEAQTVSMPVVVNHFGLTLREAVKTSAFWIILCVLFLVTSSVHACFIHLPALLSDRGSSAQLAAFASSLLGVGLFIGRVGCGYLLDQFFAPRVAALLFFVVAAGIALLGLGHSISSALIAAPLVGLGIGAEVDIVAYLTSRYFGLRSYGAIFGSIWAVFGLSGGLGAYLMGVGFDKTGSYVLPLSGFFCAALVAALLILTLGPYRYRAGLLSGATPE